MEEREVAIVVLNRLYHKEKVNKTKLSDTRIGSTESTSHPLAKMAKVTLPPRKERLRTRGVDPIITLANVGSYLF
jgi:hypothetical protein